MTFIVDDRVSATGQSVADTVGDCYIVVAGLIQEDQDGFVCVGEVDGDEVRLRSTCAT